jgi:hypothetical protein
MGSLSQYQLSGQPSLPGGSGGFPPIPGGQGAIGGAVGPQTLPVSSVSIPLPDPVAEFQALAPQLNLTPDQQAKIKAMMTSRQPALTAAEKALSDGTSAFQPVAGAGSDFAIRTGAARIGQCLGELQVLRVQTAVQMRAVLTPQQTARLLQLKAYLEDRQKQMTTELLKGLMGGPMGGQVGQIGQIGGAIPGGAAPQPAPKKPTP